MRGGAQRGAIRRGEENSVSDGSRFSAGGIAARRKWRMSATQGCQ
jgi:hypothetical protein